MSPNYHYIIQKESCFKWHCGVVTLRIVSATSSLVVGEVAKVKDDKTFFGHDLGGIGFPGWGGDGGDLGGGAGGGGGGDLEVDLVLVLVVALVGQRLIGHHTSYLIN